LEVDLIFVIIYFGFEVGILELIYGFNFIFLIGWGLLLGQLGQQHINLLLELNGIIEDILEEIIRVDVLDEIGVTRSLSVVNSYGSLESQAWVLLFKSSELL